MPENTKPKEKDDGEERKIEKPLTEIEEDTWGKDQREKSYYYDDSHGYEIYKPEEDDD